MKYSLKIITNLCYILISQGSEAQTFENHAEVHEANKINLWSHPEQAIPSEKELLELTNNDSLEARSAQLIGVGYSILSQWDSAITYHYLSLSHAKNAHDAKTIGLAYNNLGLVHLQLEDTVSAMKFLELAEPYIRETSRPSELSRFYRSQYLVLPSSHISARQSLLYKSIQAAKAGKDSSSLIGCYIDLCKLHPDSCELYIGKAESLIDPKMHPCDQVMINYAKATRLANQGKTSRAIVILEGSLKLESDVNSCNDMELSLLKLSELYEAKRDFTKARDYLDRYYDALSEQYKNEAKASYSSNYLKQLNLELEELRAEQNKNIERINSLNLATEQAQLKLNYSRQLNLVILFAMICLLVLSVVLIRMNKSKNAKQDALNKGLIELKQAHDELSKSNEALKDTQIQLIQSEKLNSIGTLVAGVAHEINNPLHYLQSGIYLLRSKEEQFKEEDERSEYQEVLDLMEKGVLEASSIVGNLKQFSRKSDFKSHTSVHLNEAISRSIQLLEHKIIRSVGSIDVLSEETFLINANEESVVQIFVNLIANALHASPEMKSIQIRIGRRPDEHVRVSVSDRGCGISAENIQKIFDPFFTTKPIGEGTGLGLSIVHKLVEEQFGKIRVESVLQKGTTFFLTFPISSAKISS